MTTLKKYKSNKISIPEFNKHIHPGDNFYLYINDKWLDNTSIPKHASSYSVNEEIEDIIEKDLYSIIDNCYNYSKKGLITKSFDSQLKDSIGRFALSALRKSVQKNSIQTLKSYLQNIHCIRSIEDIGDVLGFFCKNKVDTILTSFLQLERTKDNKSVYTLYLSHGSLGLPDISYYKASAPGKLRTLMAFIQMIKKVTNLLEIDDLSEIVSFESYFSAHYENIKNEKDFLLKGYELEKEFNKFPWNNFFTSFGIEKWEDKLFRIKSKKFIKILEKTFETSNLEQFKKLFILHMILHALPILPPPYDTIHFDFYQKRLKGQKEKYNQKYLNLNLTKIYLTTPLSILYKKYYLDNSLKRDCTRFIQKIKFSAINLIESNTWLQEKTKDTAKEKLKNMVLNIGWPEYYYPLNLPNLQTDNLLKNIYLLSSSSTQNDIKLLNSISEPGKSWNEPSFMVNAFYYNEINEFIVPAGSLMYPFYSKNKSIGWNYGGLGAVIGHEMIHAFDEDGRYYDAFGYYKPWWLLKDKRRYLFLSKKLKDLYSKSKIYGIYLDGNKTINENLADLGGVSIALHALKVELQGKSEEEKKVELQQFFISYAISWRTKEEKKKVLQSLIIDSHSPPEFRVNNILVHFQEWYDTFDITVSNKLYIAPEDRIKVF
jgi:predicted metalloendopeptidase